VYLSVAINELMVLVAVFPGMNSELNAFFSSYVFMFCMAKGLPTRHV